MEFVENKGQWHSNVKYKANFTSGAFFLEDKGFSVMLHDPKDLKARDEALHGPAVHGGADKTAGTGEKKATLPVKADGDIFPVKSFGYKVRFLGASATAQQVPEKMQSSYNNYFIGNDPGKWATECKIFHAITYQDIYPKIDLRYYNGSDGRLKYDFIVRPGGNPDYIAMEYLGPESVTVKDRELVLSTPVGEVRELHPYTYQSSAAGKPTEVRCRYVVKGNVVSFKLGDYDPNATLVIDPSIIFSSFTGSTADNWGYTATPGPGGSVYAGGIAYSTGYPVTPGVYDGTYAGGIPEGTASGYDIAIMKFSAFGTQRLYATYIGGEGNEQPHSMIADAQGNLVIAGRTNSSDYPTTRPRLGPNGSTRNYDIIITKLRVNGAGPLMGSVVIGGSAADGVNISPKYPNTNPVGASSLRRNYGDDARSEVMLDASNNIYLASCTQSDNFYTINAVQGTSGGEQDGVIMKFNADLSVPLFSTYFGGSQNDACFVTNLNPLTGDLYIAGASASSTLPGSGAGAVISNTNSGGDADGFVTQLRNDGSAVVRTTFLGTGGVDMVYGLKFDKFGYPYVMGTSTGNWPIINATFSHNGGKQFISKLQPDLSAYVYSTVFGTNSSAPNISPIAFLVDRCENVYVSGWGGGVNVDFRYTTGTTAGLSVVNPLAGIPAPDGRDFYFFVLERDATSQLFGSHFGQNGGFGDHVDGGTSRFDENGIIYQAICANCGRGAIFPTTAGVIGPDNGSTTCNQAVVKIEMNFAGVGASVQTSIDGVRSNKGCVPLEVVFTDSLRKGKTFYWSFGDGSPQVITTVPTVTHTYTSIGTFTAMLISEDSSTCNIRDTAYTNIIVGDNRAIPAFTFTKLPPCESNTMRFTNTSTATTGSFGSRSFVWDYGDGSAPDTTGANPIDHTYPAPGTYIVKLTLIDTLFCNAPEFITDTIRINALVEARFTTPAFGCAPYTAEFDNTSLAGTDFIWEFGDGSTSTDMYPTHLYANPGVYQVRLIAIDLTTCNLRDTSAYFTITVQAKPVAAFGWGPNPPTQNTPVQFTNNSTGAIRYLWNFGDGESSTLTNPSHQYNATNTYDVELIAYNAAGCTDTARQPVRTLIVPALDVPNAFTPAQGGRNAVVRVEGFGIGKMQWRIFNRQGQVVFESNSFKSGWDGTYKGKLQPMDVYTYTLDVEFTDGKKLRKTGDITLLR